MKQIRLVMIIILMACAVLFITGCGNKDIWDFKYTFDKIVCNYNGDKFELKIKKWKDYEGEQIQVQTKNKTYLLSTNNCYLIDE